jgi:hypothetical protein
LNSDDTGFVKQGTHAVRVRPTVQRHARHLSDRRNPEASRALCFCCEPKGT